jgi:tetratricopeptide (TPR) repeat protein
MCTNKALVRLALALAFAAAACPALVRADEVDRRKLYVNNIKGCVGVMTAGGPASGWVVDVEKRWIVTAQHVVGGKEDVEIVFPAFKDGKLIQDRDYYVKTAPRIKGKVVSADVKRDLVIIQIDSLPKGMAPLRLASDSGQPGDNLYMIGNPAASGAMWNYSLGTLRAVYKKRFTYKNTSHEVDAVIGETQLPGNPGDSGAAVFNDRGEVVGVHSGGTPDGIQLMATYIDIVEVRAFLKEPLKGVAKVNSFDEFLSRGAEAYAKGDYDKAIAAYTEAIKLNPNHSEAFRRRASAFIRKKMYDKAMEDCNESLRLNRGNATAYNERAVCYGALGDFKAALGDYNEAIRLNANEFLYWQGRAWTYNAMKEYDKALDDANAAIKLNSKDSLSWNERGLAYFWKQKYDNAFDDFNEAIKLDPNQMEPHYHRGVIKAIRKNYGDAIADFSAAIRLNPKYFYAWLERGKAYHNLGQYDKAIKDYTETLAVNPKNAQAYLYRSWCHKELGNQAQADADYRQATDLDPKIKISRGTRDR